MKINKKISLLLALLLVGAGALGSIAYQSRAQTGTAVAVSDTDNITDPTDAPGVADPVDAPIETGTSDVNENESNDAITGEIEDSDSPSQNDSAETGESANDLDGGANDALN